MLTLHWNYYDVYVCITGRVTITDSDGMGPCTRVYAIRRVWAPTVMPYLRQVMSASVPQGRCAGRGYPYMEAPRWGG
jgi:hypothetical protein